jgi:hypothetical protein
MFASRTPSGRERRRESVHMTNVEPGIPKAIDSPVAGPSKVTDLAERAIACYQAELGHRGLPSSWRSRAARAAWILAAILGVDPACVSAVPDPDRDIGPQNVGEVRLIVRYPGMPGNGFEFVPEYCSIDTFVLLAGCPGCSRQVPMYRVASLADLGRYLARDGMTEPDVEQFVSDPGHERDCSRWQESVGYATSYRSRAPGSAR